jgi:hypothetical protein
MRMRSIPYLAITFISWFIVWRYFKSAHKMYAGYDLVIVDAPLPDSVRTLGLGGFLTAIVGMPMLIVDFVRWIKTRRP